MLIRPLYDKVLIKPDAPEEKTEGGLFIPDAAQEKPRSATVIAIGSGAILEDGSIRPLDVAVGDKILYAKYSRSEIKVDGVDHLILKEDEIIGVLEVETENAS